MRYILISLFLLGSACASKSRLPSSANVAPGEALELEQALQQGAAPTLAYLKAQTSVTAYEGLSSRDPAVNLPKSIKAERSVQSSKEKSVQQMYLRKFRAWSLAKKM